MYSMYSLVGTSPSSMYRLVQKVSGMHKTRLRCMHPRYGYPAYGFDNGQPDKGLTPDPACSVAGEIVYMDLACMQPSLVVCVPDTF